MKSMGILAVSLLLGLFLAAGCSQQNCCGKCKDGCKSAETTAKPAASAQKNCPVTGEAVDLAVSTDYKGEKVYFCCKGCIAKFEKDPEKYMASLK